MRTKNVHSVTEEKEQKSFFEKKEGKSKRKKESQVVWNCKIECGGNSLQIANKPPKSRSIF